MFWAPLTSAPRLVTPGQWQKKYSLYPLLAAVGPLRWIRIRKSAVFPKVVDDETLLDRDFVPWTETAATAAVPSKAPVEAPAWPMGRGFTPWNHHGSAE